MSTYISVQVILASVWDSKRTFGHVDRIPKIDNLTVDESVLFNWPDLISFKVLKVEEREGL